MNNKSLANTLFSGVFWKLGERILAQGISFLISIILARLLLPEDYGIVTIVLVFITIADLFVLSGFGTALIQKKDANETDFSTVFYCGLVVSVILYIIIYISAPLVAGFYGMPILVKVLRVFAIRLPISAYNSIQHAYVSRHMLFKCFFFSTLFGTVISGIVGVMLALIDFGVWALVAQYLVNTIIDSIVLSFTISWKPRLLFSWKAAKKLLNFGWKVLITDLLGTFFDQLRLVVVGKVYSSADLAFYSKGVQIPTLISDNIIVSVMSVLFPFVSNVNDDLTKVKGIVRKAMNVLAYLMFPIMTICAIVSDSLIILLFTEKWEKSIHIMQLMCIQSAVSIVGSVGIQVIKAIGRSDILLKLEFCKKPVYVFLLIVGAHYDVTGIAISMVVYSIYGTILNGWILRRVIRYKYIEQWKDLSNGIVVSFGIGCGMSIVLMFDIPYIISFILQILFGMICFIYISKLLHMEGYILIKEYFLSWINNNTCKKN